VQTGKYDYHFDKIQSATQMGGQDNHIMCIMKLSNSSSSGIFVSFFQILSFL